MVARDFWSGEVVSISHEVRTEPGAVAGGQGAISMTTEEIWDDFLSTTCSVCGEKKTRMQTFCRGDYRRLPSQMRQALWRRFSERYEECLRTAEELLQMPPRTGRRCVDK